MSNIAYLLCIVFLTFGASHSVYGQNNSVNQPTSGPEFQEYAPVQEPLKIDTFAETNHVVIFHPEVGVGFELERINGEDQQYIKTELEGYGVPIAIIYSSGVVIVSLDGISESTRIQMISQIPHILYENFFRHVRIVPHLYEAIVVRSAPEFIHPSNKDRKLCK